MNSNQVNEQQTSNFATKVIYSAGWSGLASYLQLITSFLGNLLLARILLPSDFGIFALASSLLTVLYMFAGFGSQEAIVQCRNSSISKLIPTAFWITVGIAGGLSIAGILLAMVLRSFYSDAVAQLIAVLAVLRFFTNIAHLFRAILQREMRFKPIAFVSTLSTFASFLLAGLAAWLGAGYWALLLREAVAGAISLIGLWRASGYRIEYQIDQATALWIWHFGWRMMVSRITEVVFERFDNLVIGTFLGTVTLGYYSVAYRQAYLIQQATQGAMHAVIFSAFSAIQDSGKKLSYGFTKLNFWLWRVAIPLGILFGLIGDKLVIWVYGDKWIIAGKLFQNMFIFSTLLPIDVALKNLLVGAGHVNGVMRIRVLQLALSIPLILGAAYWLNVFAIAWIINASLLLSCLLMMRFADSFMDINWKYLLKAPLIAGFGALILGYVSLKLFSSITYIGLFLIVVIIVIFFAYIGILILLDHSALAVEVDILRTRLRKTNVQA